MPANHCHHPCENRKICRTFSSMRLDHGSEIRTDDSTIRLPTRVVHFEIPCRSRVFLETPTPYPLFSLRFQWRIRDFSSIGVLSDPQKPLGRAGTLSSIIDDPKGHSNTAN